MMISPGMLLGAVLSSLFGALFHLWRGGGGGRLFLYLFLSWIGFAIGHALGGLFGWTFWQTGTLNTGAGALGSILMLGLGYWLSLIDSAEIED